MSQAITLHKRYIKGTEQNAIVTDIRVLVCNLTIAVVNGAHRKVYINTRVLKHIYDKRPAQEYDFLLEYIHQVIKYPDRVYENREGKRGNYAFVKEIKNQLCFSAIQIVDSNTDEEKYYCEIATFFRLAKTSYLNRYKLLWSWEGGGLPS